MKNKLNVILMFMAVLVLSNVVSASVTLDLSTGVNVGAVGNPLYVSPARDDNWMVLTTPPGNTLQNVKAWIKYNMSGWNKVDGTLPIFGNTDATGTTEYERCFCISNPEGATLDLTLRADNKANVFLNSYFPSIMTAAVNNTFNNPVVPAVQFTANTQNSGLKVGKNCIRVRVNNEGGPTGFALKAILKAKSAQDTFQPNSCCQQGAPVFSEAMKISQEPQ